MLSPGGRIVVRKVKSTKSFYSDSEDDSETEEVVVEDPNLDMPSHSPVDLSSDNRFLNDHKLALRASLPLLKSRNAGVVLGVCCLHFYCGSDDQGILGQLAKALVRILRNRREIQLVILNSVRAMAIQRPSMFASFLQDFFVKGSDPLYNRLTKLQILTSLVNRENYRTVLQELESYVKQSNKTFVASALECIYFTAQAGEDEEMISSCIRGLQHLLLCHRLDPLAGSISDVLRRLVALLRNSEEKQKAVRHMTRYILECESQSDGFLHRSAIPPMIWLTGEYCQSVISIAPDLLRYYASVFVNEDVKAKNQILNAAVKISLVLPENETVQSLMMYIVECARYDTSTDLRDRSRVITAIMGMVPSTENGEGAAFSSATEDALEELTAHAKSILLGNKPISQPSHCYVNLETFPYPTIYSLSAQIDHLLPGYIEMPPWALENSDSKARDVKEAVSSGDYEEWNKSMIPSSTENGANLRQFYESHESDEEEDEDSSDDESGDDESTDDADDEEESEESLGESGSSVESLPAVRSNRPPTAMRLPPATSRPTSLLEIDLPTTVGIPQSSSGKVSSDDQILAQLMESFPASKRVLKNTEAVQLNNFSATTTLAPSVVSSMEGLHSFPPKVLLRSDLARGLQIKLQYRHGNLSTQIPGGSSMLLTIENKKAQPVRSDDIMEIDNYS